MSIYRSYLIRCVPEPMQGKAPRVTHDWSFGVRRQHAACPEELKHEDNAPVHWGVDSGSASSRRREHRGSSVTLPVLVSKAAGPVK
jgi:hypothetical protein